MSSCEKIRTDVVICDEIFYFDHVEIDVPLGFDAPAGSTLAGTVTVTLASGDVFIGSDDMFWLEAMFMVQKELLLTTPDDETFPLEFMERMVFLEPYRKCDATVLDILDLTPEQLSCHIVYTGARDTLILNTDTNTFSEELTIELKAKILAEEQIFVRLCSARRSVDIPIFTA